MNPINCPLQKAALECPEKPAFISGDICLNYFQLNEKVKAVTQFLFNNSIQANTRVAIYAKNSINYSVLLLALWRVKSVACLINQRIPVNAAMNQIRKLGAGYLFSDESVFSSMETGELKIFSLDQIINFKNRIRKKGGQDNILFDAEQDAAILYTSGSSGPPKAALLSWGNFYWNAYASNDRLAYSHESAWLLSLPLFHVGGLGIIFRTLIAQATMIFPFNNERIEDCLMHNDRITHLSLVPTQLYRLLKSDEIISKLSKYKAVLVGGSPVPDSLIKTALEKRLSIHLTYGLTEMASQVATSDQLLLKNSEFKIKILAGQQVMISSDNEIFLKGKGLFKGYLENGILNAGRTVDGWFPSGDLGELSDGDLLKVNGRKDNMFISGGENIQPEEIELLLSELPEIEQAVVVPITDNEFGKIPVAFIKPRMNTEIDNKKINEELSKKIPKYKLPRQYYILSDLTKDNEFKINRLELHKRAQSYHAKTFLRN